MQNKYCRSGTLERKIQWPVVYSPEILDHFEHPRNPGIVALADATIQVENPGCGDVLKLTARCSGGRITEVRFQAKGCVPAMASASALTELVAGKTLDDASRVRREDLLHALGRLPPASNHASYLALEALSALLEHLKSNYRVP